MNESEIALSDQGRLRYSIVVRFFCMQTDKAVLQWCTGDTDKVGEGENFFRNGILASYVVNPFIGDTKQANILFVSSTADFDHLCRVLSNRRRRRKGDLLQGADRHIRLLLLMQ